MGNLPRGWALTEFENVVDILDNLRVPINASERAGRQGNIPYYGATGRVGWIDDYLFDEELILLGEDGAPFFDKSKKIAFLIEGKSWVNNHAHVLRAKGGVSVNNYLLHYLNYFDFNGWVGGSTRLKLTQGNLRKLPVLVPPYNEQCRIAEKLDELLGKLSEIKDRLNRVPELISRFRQSVIDAACLGRLTADWRATNQSVDAETVIQGIRRQRLDAARSDRERRQIENIFEEDCDGGEDLPPSWACVTLKKVVVSAEYGSSFKSQKVGKVPVLRMGNLQGGEIDWSDLVYSSNKDEISKYKLEPMTVLFNRTNSPELVGKTAIFRGEREALFAGYLIRLIPVGVLDPEFLNICLNSSMAKNYCRRVKPTE